VKSLHNHIGGEPAHPASRAFLDVIDPATGSTYARVPDSGPDDVDAAVAAARSAFPAWAATPPADRSRLLLALAELLERDLEHLARAESIDTGKPISLARTVDIPRAVANLRFFATAVLHADGTMHDTSLPGPPGNVRALNYTLRRPRGVAGLISPWNLPLYLFTWKIAPALATGNTVVGKPSELTPVTAAMLADLSVEAGLPAGVLNIVHGRGPTCGAAIVEHPHVPTLSFTGSTAVGRWIGETAGRMLKRVSLELGGKNPNVIFADADPDRAVDEATRAAFSNQGQICLCGSRVLVERAIFDQVVEGLAARACELHIGDPLDEHTRFGAITSREQLRKIESYVEIAREAGGTIHCGGRSPQTLPQRCRGGYYYEPTVISGLPPDCRVLTEEIFGPVVTVQAFEDEDEAVALANATDYGLAAMVWTSDLGRAHRVAERIDSGVVWVNCWMVRDLRTPFGGVKQSGVGREGGQEALRFFTEPKNVCVRV